MNDLFFSNPIKKGLQAALLLAIVLHNFGIGGTSIAYAAPPVNDDFDSAILINSITFLDSLDTTTATPPEPIPPDALLDDDPDAIDSCSTADGSDILNSGLHTVWYKYTPQINESISLDTLGSNYDTFIAVWTGARGALNLVICNNDTFEAIQSELSFTANAGTQYYIEIALGNGIEGGTPPPPSVFGNLEFHAYITTTNVTIGGTLMGKYYVAPDNSLRRSYAGVDNGPVKVVNTTALPIVAGLRELWIQNGLATSSFQMMALPSSQLSDTYWFPAYNNVTLNEQVRFGNVGATNTNVTVTIGGIVKGTYPLTPNQQMRVNYAGVDSGPVKVQSSGGVKIIAAIRDAWFAGTAVESFSQLMGLPDAQLSDTYWFPSYNNVTLNEQLRFGNVGVADTNVTVTIGASSFGPYLLHPNEQFRINYPGVDSGPVKVQGTSGVKIIAAIREAWFQGSSVKSWIQLMGLPAPQLSDTYYFPAYDNVSLNGQLRFGNVGASNTTVTVTIGGVVKGTYPLTPNQQLRVNYAGLDSGPVKVQSSGGVKIIAALRDALFVNNIVESFAQMMGLPGTQLSDTYLLPAYNNVTLDEQLRFGVP